eukprot:TRINITY_DN21668_c0_g2_i1.p1 TRINITY_DN21668_c0_g2~~TRINITY_DN21668_c0_g2_i1.p1  ORF type:complete len:222 (-),score=19.31 TRINITY_DN21668_c0_g2_i1:61-726(-)
MCIRDRVSTQSTWLLITASVFVLVNAFSSELQGAMENKETSSQSQNNTFTDSESSSTQTSDQKDGDFGVILLAVSTLGVMHSLISIGWCLVIGRCLFYIRKGCYDQKLPEVGDNADTLRYLYGRNNSKVYPLDNTLRTNNSKVDITLKVEGTNESTINSAAKLPTKQRLSTVLYPRTSTVALPNRKHSLSQFSKLALPSQTLNIGETDFKDSVQTLSLIHI